MFKTLKSSYFWRFFFIKIRLSRLAAELGEWWTAAKRKKTKSNESVFISSFTGEFSLHFFTFSITALHSLDFRFFIFQWKSFSSCCSLMNFILFSLFCGEIISSLHSLMNFLFISYFSKKITVHSLMIVFFISSLFYEKLFSPSSANDFYHIFIN